MRNLIDVTGASGSVYRFHRLRDGRPLSAMGGNYVYSRENGDGYEVVYVGQGENLLKDAHGRWDEAVKTQAAAHLYTRLNISERVRQHEHADILAAGQPAMNGRRRKAAAA